MWDWIRRGAGLVFLAYIIFVNPPGLPSWVGLLIAGLLGLPDVIAGQFAINMRERRERRESRVDVTVNTDDEDSE